MSFFIFFVFIIAIFYLLSRSYAKNPSGFNDRNFKVQDAKYFIKLIAKVAKSDGTISKEEAYHISLILDDICEKLKNSALRDELKVVFNNTVRDSQISAFEIAKEYKIALNLSQMACFNLVIFLLNLAYIDGKFSSDERAVLNEICMGFGIDDNARNDLFSRFESEFTAKFQTYSQNDPYKVLGVLENATFEEIKKRYRTLAKENHPDFLMGQGADKEVISNATKKLQEINEAYAILKKKFQK